MSEREKFIYHVGMNVMMIGGSYDGNISEIIEHVRKHRCRNLTDKDVHNLLEIMRDELLISKIMWEEP